MTESDAPRQFWRDMPTELKARLMGWTIYWLIVAWMVSQGMLLGIALLVAPGLWWVAKSWFLDDFLGIGVMSDKPSLASYTLNFLWESSLYVCAFVVVSLIAAALGGLGWLGTEEMRAEAAKPTLTESVAEAAQSAKEGAVGMAVAARDTAGDLADGTRETTKSWFATAKGWFAADDQE